MSCVRNDRCLKKRQVGCTPTAKACQAASGARESAQPMTALWGAWPSFTKAFLAMKVVSIGNPAQTIY